MTQSKGFAMSQVAEILIMLGVKHQPINQSKSFDWIIFFFIIKYVLEFELPSYADDI